MSKIWEKNIGYSLFYLYTKYATESSFSKITVVGKENVPKDGAILYAPNHCNTLMDALVVLTQIDGFSAFGARADIFRKPKIAAFMNFLRMVPIARERDGLKAVADSVGVYDEIVECLRHDVPFTLFCEGTHRAKRSLLPFKKGLFRLALKAYRELDGKEVYIVPVGIDYDNYYDMMHPVKISFGEPMKVSGYLAGVEDSEENKDAAIMREMSSTLRERIASLITYFPDDENYDKVFAEWEAGRKIRGAKLVAKIAGAVVCSPLFVASAIAGGPMLLINKYACSMQKDPVWNNTMRNCAMFLIRPVIALLVAIISLCLGLGWWTLLSVFVTWVAPNIFYLLLRLYKY